MNHALARWRPAGSAAVLVVTALLLISCSARPQPRTVTLLYVDMTRSTVSAKTSVLRDVEVLLNEVASERGRLLVDIIDDNPLAHARVVADLSFAVPEAHGNRLVERRKLDERRAAAAATLRSLLEQPRPARSTDVFGALVVAGQRLQAFEGPGWRRRVVLLSDMVSTIPSRSLVASRWDRRSIDRLVERLRTDRMLPRLPDTEVWVSGAGLSAGDGLQATTILGIKAVWLAVFAATGATVTFYGPQLLKLSRGA